MSYYWNRIFQFLWLVILICDFGIRAVDGVDLIDRELLYGFEPTLGVIMFGSKQREHGFGISTMADIWIGLFPASMAVVFTYLQAKSLAEYANIRVEKQNLIKADQLAAYGQGIELQSP